MKKLELLKQWVGHQLDRFVMWFYYHLVLKYLIMRNYRLRYKSALNGDGKYPDVWYWADSLATRYGYFTNRDSYEVTTVGNIKAFKFVKDSFYNSNEINPCCDWCGGQSEKLAPLENGDSVCDECVNRGLH